MVLSQFEQTDAGELLHRGLAEQRQDLDQRRQAQSQGGQQSGARNQKRNSSTSSASPRTDALETSASSGNHSPSHHAHHDAYHHGDYSASHNAPEKRRREEKGKVESGKEACKEGSIPTPERDRSESPDLWIKDYERAKRGNGPVDLSGATRQDIQPERKKSQAEPEDRIQW